MVEFILTDGVAVVMVNNMKTKKKIMIHMVGEKWRGCGKCFGSGRWRS